MGQLSHRVDVPFPLFGDFGISLLDELAHASKGLSTPIAQFANPLRDEIRSRCVLACVRFLHVPLPKIPRIFSIARSYQRKSSAGLHCHPRMNFRR
jgi:hypothetical protein